MNRAPHAVPVWPLRGRRIEPLILGNAAIEALGKPCKPRGVSIWAEITDYEAVVSDAFEESMQQIITGWQ